MQVGQWASEIRSRKETIAEPMLERIKVRIRVMAVSMERRHIKELLRM